MAVISILVLEMLFSDVGRYLLKLLLLLLKRPQILLALRPHVVRRGMVPGQVLA